MWENNEKKKEKKEKKECDYLFIFRWLIRMRKHFRVTWCHNQRYNQKEGRIRDGYLSTIQSRKRRWNKRHLLINSLIKLKTCLIGILWTMIVFSLIVLVWCIPCDLVLTMHECMNMTWSLRRAPEVVIVATNRLCYSQWVGYSYYFTIVSWPTLPLCDVNLNFLSNHEK